MNFVSFGSAPLVPAVRLFTIWVTILKVKNSEFVFLFTNSFAKFTPSMFRFLNGPFACLCVLAGLLVGLFRSIFCLARLPLNGCLTVASKCYAKIWKGNDVPNAFFFLPVTRNLRPLKPSNPCLCFWICNRFAPKVGQPRAPCPVLVPFFLPFLIWNHLARPARRCLFIDRTN